MTDVVLINGNTKKESIGKTLANEYINKLKNENLNIKTYDVSEFEFHRDLDNGYKTPLSPIVSEIQNKMAEAKLLVFIIPIYWGTFPGKFKSLFDQLLWPDVAFNLREKKYLWRGPWRGKRVRIIYTLGGSKLTNIFLSRNTGITSLKVSLNITGIFSIKKTAIENLDVSKKRVKIDYFKKIFNAAQKDIKFLK
ncbi:MAG: NAD(P)H-dependent oxidoreductase [Sebaldella sp.]|nr:NAD(P)H-dependent oxidoreductase [Sebaldella sp.]